MSFNVLVVDDSAVMRAMIIRVVKMSGVPLGEFYEAANGEEGLRRRARALGRPRPARHQHARDERRGDAPAAPRRSRDAQLPVIVVSTESSETRVQTLQALGVAFVHKPFTPESLRATILRVTGVTPDDEYYAVPAADGSDFDF